MSEGRRRRPAGPGASAAALCGGLVAFGALGCATHVMAPPVRLTHGGPPARLETGELEGALGATTTLPFGPVVPVSAGISVAVADRLQLELGAEMPLPYGLWTMGWTGLRYTFVDTLNGAVRNVGDLELGVGAGAGGVQVCDDHPIDERCGVDGQEDGIPWHLRPAGGAYGGGSLGIRWQWITAFSRLRAEVTAAQNIQPTLWLSALAGVGFDVLGRADLHVAAGFATFRNEISHGSFWVLEVAVAVPVRLF